MLDIHCHIVPNVDDGSGSMSDSIEMARLAAASGTHGIIATPHCNIPGSFTNYWDENMVKKFDQLKAQIKSLNIPINLYQGQEVFLASGFLQLLRAGKLISLNNSRYILIEFSYEEKISIVLRKIEQIVAEGYVPVVAHPERYRFIFEQTDSVYKIKDAGGLIQINKGSLKGKFGRHAMKTAFEILRNREADFVASDGHSQYSRTPYLADAHQIVSEHCSSDYADYLLKTNPRKVVENKDIFVF